MVFNGEVVVKVATLSADLCQYVAFNPERFDGRDVLRLLCLFPLRLLGRLVLCFGSFLCPFSSYSSYRYLRSPSSSSSSSSSSSYSSSSEDEDLVDLMEAADDDDENGSYRYDHPHSD